MTQAQAEAARQTHGVLAVGDEHTQKMFTALAHALTSTAAGGMAVEVDSRHHHKGPHARVVVTVVSKVC